jgi:VanZ family protein
VISTLLAENADVLRVAFWVGVAACALVGWLLYRSRSNRALLVLAAIALAGMFVLTLSPSDGYAASPCTVQFSIPFQGIDTLANLAMTVPLALFASLRYRRPLAVLAAVSLLSVLIELVQAALPALGRACDTNDWLMNTVGAAVGALLAIGIIVGSRRRTSRSQ